MPAPVSLNRFATALFTQLAPRLPRRSLALQLAHNLERIRQLPDRATRAARYADAYLEIESQLTKTAGERRKLRREAAAIANATLLGPLALLFGSGPQKEAALYEHVTQALLDHLRPHQPAAALERDLARLARGTPLASLRLTRGKLRIADASYQRQLISHHREIAAAFDTLITHLLGEIEQHGETGEAARAVHHVADNVGRLAAYWPPAEKLARLIRQRAKQLEPLTWNSLAEREDPSRVAATLTQQGSEQPIMLHVAPLHHDAAPDLTVVTLAPPESPRQLPPPASVVQTLAETNQRLNHEQLKLQRELHRAQQRATASLRRELKLQSRLAELEKHQQRLNERLNYLEQHLDSHANRLPHRSEHELDFPAAFFFSPKHKE